MFIRTKLFLKQRNKLNWSKTLTLCSWFCQYFFISIDFWKEKTTRMLSELRNHPQATKVVPYPYQKRPVVVRGEDDSTEESLLFRKGKGITQKRAHSASDAVRKDRSAFNNNSNHNQRIPKEILTGSGPASPANELDNGLSTKGQELYIVDGREGQGKSLFLILSDVMLIDKLQQTFRAWIIMLSNQIHGQH